MRKQWLTDYFSFTKKERTGILVLLACILLATLLPLCYPLFHKPSAANDATLQQQAAALARQQDSITAGLPCKYNARRQYPGQQYKRPADAISSGELFSFDPNTLSPADWKRLGLRDKTITTIQRYLSKGGHFYQPEDIGKIWGLHPDEVARLLPYVHIAQRENPARSYVHQSPSDYPRYEKPLTARTPATIDINTADTTAWIALPGIGSKLATRIVTFREKLGGFYSIDQVGNTYGLPDSVFQRLKPRLQLGHTGVRQLNINTAGLDELKKHPLIRYALANAIVQYRNQHGPFASVDDLKKIMMVTPEIFAQAAPYLAVQ